MRLSMILAIARAEIRSIRRLVRYWMFAVLSVGITFLIYLYYAGIHGFVSRFSATIGAGAPRYLMSPMGIYLMVIFLLGLIFLAFDVRARDERERIAEVLDSRPVSNPELLVGRGIGLVLMALVPVLVVTVAMQTFGSAAVLFGWDLGEPVEPYSMVGFILDAVSTFTLWCVVVMLLAVLLRNRLLVALAALILVGVQFWLAFRLPLYLQGVVSLILTFNLASDLVPTLGTSAALAKRLALLIMASGGISLAAALHPRPDGGSKLRRLALGGSLVAVGGLIIGSLAQQATADMDQRAGWLAAHKQHEDDPRADMRSMSGRVSIDPGRGVDLDLEIRVQAPPDTQLETLLFTLNPGLTVEEVETRGAAATWTHADGLFEITPSSAVTPGGEVIVTLVASGEPDVRFGYLDSEINVLTGPFIDGNLVLLGIESGIFSTGYVALMPGLRWLPHPGSDVPAGDPQTHPADFFEVELEVEVPADWLVAGPGRRETLEAGSDTAHFRFHPGAPVPHVGLLASRFERRAIQAAGVEIEVLVHPTHDRNLLFFADAADEIAARAEEIFTDAERLGLPYPYGGLTLVESPLTLRGYGGGWRMDTTQTMPGILLLRENSFTTSRFEFEFRDPDSFGERDGGLARAKVEAIERFFENDFSGGNLFLGGSRNFLLFQTSARGEGALALNFVIEELVSQLLTGKRGYFSPFMFDRQSGLVIGETIGSVVTGQMDSVVEAVLSATSDRPSVWDRALASSLAELDPTEDARQSLNVLALKSHAIARSILDGLGTREDRRTSLRVADPLRWGALRRDRFRADRDRARCRPGAVARRLAPRGDAARIHRLPGCGRAADRRRPGHASLPDPGPSAQRRIDAGAAAPALHRRRRHERDRDPLGRNRAGASSWSRGGRDWARRLDSAPRDLVGALPVAQPAGCPVDLAADRFRGAGARGALSRPPPQHLAPRRGEGHRGRRPRPGVHGRDRRGGERCPARRRSGGFLHWCPRYGPRVARGKRVHRAARGLEPAGGVAELGQVPAHDCPHQERRREHTRVVHGQHSRLRALASGVPPTHTE